MILRVEKNQKSWLSKIFQIIKLKLEINILLPRLISHWEKVFDS